MSSGGRKPEQTVRCRWYAQGYCRFGAKCKFSHAVDIQSQHASGSNTPRLSLQSRNIQAEESEPQLQYSALGITTTATASGISSHAGRSRAKRPSKAARNRKAGVNSNGTTAQSNLDPETQGHPPGEVSARDTQVGHEKVYQQAEEQEGGETYHVALERVREQLDHAHRARQGREGSVRAAENARLAEEQRAEIARQDAARRAELEQRAERARQEAARQAELEQENERQLAEQRARAEAHRMAIERKEARRLALEREREEAHRLAREREEARRLALERARAEREERERVRRAKQAEEEAAREAARQAHLAEVARQDAAKTIQCLVLGSIVTFGAGLDIRNIITGFESCTVRVRNLPADARGDEVCALFTQQGIDATRFHVVAIKRVPQGTQEAEVVTDAESGQALAAGLDGIEFRDETLTFEVGAYNSPSGLSERSEGATDVLTISWRAPSMRYVIEYADIPFAQSKVRELNHRMLLGRRVKVEMNTLPPGRAVPSFRPNSVKITNLPMTVTQDDVVQFAASDLVRPLKGASSYDVNEAIRLLRREIELAAPDTLISMTPSPNANKFDGVLSYQAKFGSWDEAQKIHESLADRRFAFIGNATLWLHLNDPMLYTIIISADQYQAQRAQWASLVASIKDRKASTLTMREQDNVVRIRLSGSVKQAIGTLKVRVEALLAGEKVDGWHPTLGYSKNGFLRAVFTETGAFVRGDWRRQVLKVYGEPQAVENARTMIKAELERLASLEWSVTLQRQSVSFFIRQGIPSLKETFGEDSVKFTAGSRRITITGGTEAQHALSCLITESLDEHNALPSSSSPQHTCPICFDDVSTPIRLGCGHVYCTACMRHFLVSAAESDQFPLNCMGDESQCGVPIPIPMVQRFLPPASFNHLLEVVYNSHIARHPQELKYCKTPDCTQIYRYAGPNFPAALQCPSCFSTLCASCHEDGHEGLSCAEHKARTDPEEQERLNDAWMMQQGGRVKKCPVCSVFIEKTEGCNHMSCRCGAHICWRCLGVFSRETIYPHMTTAHGGIHDDGGPVPQAAGFNVDYAEQQELLRQVQIRRQAERALAAANFLRPDPPVVHAPQGGNFEGAEDFWRAEERRMRALREDRERLALIAARRIEEERQREVRRRAQEVQQERERAQREQERQQQGWGCTVM